MSTRTMLAMLLLLGSVLPARAEITPAERQRLLAHLEMTSAWLADEVATLSPAQIEYRRAPGTWNILEVVEHLVVVGPIYWDALMKGVQSPPGEKKTRFTDADLLWYGIDRTDREPAVPAEMPPRTPGDLKTALAAYRRAHERLVHYVRTTKDDLRTHYVERQGCDAYQWALLISTHEQRHILQIREIKAAAGFPRR
jgi:hypothetical protein